MSESPGRLHRSPPSSKTRPRRSRSRRSSDGVYWELDSQSKTWVAYKRYSGNVVLVWFSGSKEQAADERFDRLDSILSGLPG